MKISSVCKMWSRLNRKYLSAIICIIGALVGSWMVLFPFRKLPFLGKYGVILGKNPIIHAFIIGSFFLYLHLLITRPNLAKTSLKDSLKTVKDLAIYVIAAIFIAGAVSNLYPATALTVLLGEQAGIIAIVVGVGIGSLLPACPFISYPIIGGLYAAGAGFLGVMGMLFGAGLGFACVIAADLSFFNTRVLAFRVTLSLATAILAGLLVYVSPVSL